MSVSKWHQLARIADAKFQQQAQTMRAWQQQQDNLTLRQSALDQMSDQARDALRDVHPAHFRSADVQWQSWVGRNKSELNMEAARLLARREHLLPDLRRAFAQKQACEEIVQSMEQARSGYR